MNSGLLSRARLAPSDGYVCVGAPWLGSISDGLWLIGRALSANNQSAPRLPMTRRRISQCLLTLRLKLGLELPIVVAQASHIVKSSQMSGRRSVLFISLLAVALNVVGAPLARVHMANMDHAPASVVSGMEHCKGHMDAAKPERSPSPASGHLACCKAGACTCGCLHAAAIAVLAISTHATAPDSAPTEHHGAVPAEPVEDPLRPPIT